MACSCQDQPVEQELEVEEVVELSAEEALTLRVERLEAAIKSIGVQLVSSSV